MEGLPTAIVPLTELRAGGPPPDGIPPIDAARFVTARSADFLADTEPVLAVDVNGEHRAYPVQILIWHEIVNDTIAGVPVAVTYCPLCNSAVAYDRRIAGRVLSFGTSGLLWRSALVMYDRQTESLWSHYTGEAIAGQLTGSELDNFPVSTVPWGVWRDAHPDALVLGRDTGFDRSYGSNPYPGYDDVDGTPFLFEGEVDGTFTAMTRIVGVESGNTVLAVPLTRLRDERVVDIGVDGRKAAVFWRPGVASALDTVEIADGDDVGVTGVFERSVDGRELSFTATTEGFTDEETDSKWNVLGLATSGPLAGRQLTSITHVDTFWFAWATFHPDTEVAKG
ncbi:MAG: DUF3179 domain-containing protein [Acidimicrobiia bacterium]